MQALLGWFFLGTWIVIVWCAIKLVQDLRGFVRDASRRRTLSHQ